MCALSGAFHLFNERIDQNNQRGKSVTLIAPYSALLFYISLTLLVDLFSGNRDIDSSINGFMNYSVLKIYSGSSLFPHLTLCHIFKGTAVFRRTLLPVLSIIAGTLLLSDLLHLIWPGVAMLRLLSYLAIVISMLSFGSAIYLRNKIALQNFSVERSDLLKHKFSLMALLLSNVIFLFYHVPLLPLIHFELTFVLFFLLYAKTAFLYLNKRNKKIGRYTLQPIGRPGLLEEDYLYSRRYCDSPEAIMDAKVPLKERLVTAFEIDKHYLRNDVSIESIAVLLHTNKSYLSKTLNNELHMNFREFVNHYRIRTAIEYFADDPTLTMNELREKTGFNNNSSFNSAFKINTGKTPAEWCRDYKNSRDEGKVIS